MIHDTYHIRCILQHLSMTGTESKARDTSAPSSSQPFYSIYRRSPDRQIGVIPGEPNSQKKKKKKKRKEKKRKEKEKERKNETFFLTWVLTDHTCEEETEEFG